MLTRRDFMGKLIGGVAAGTAAASTDLWAAGRLAWPGPIGLELYTVRFMFAKHPATTLKEVAAIGYKEVEIAPGLKPSTLNQDLRNAGLTAPSGYFNVPKTTDGWKASVERAHRYGLKYIVVGDAARLSEEGWKRRAALFNQWGKISRDAGIQFCYHAHFPEFERVDHTSGYDILLTECDPHLLKMEMDIFWTVYAGKDPLTYWRRYPGRFPLLHIKDMRKGVKINRHEFPKPNGPNPFVSVGDGIINWKRIFAHVHEAGAKYIYVEQDRCNRPPLVAAKSSYEYLRHLRLD